MTVLKIKAKVKEISEQDMELEELDLGIIAKSKDWVWRSQAILTYQIYKITEFSPSRSVIQMYNEEKILVLESFDELYQRWQEAIKDEEEPKNNEEGEEIFDKGEE